MSDKRAEKLRLQAEAAVGRPVRAAAIVAPRGNMGASLTGGIAGAAAHGKASKKAGGFASRNLLAVTEDALVVHKAGTGLVGWSIKQELFTLPWGTFTATSGVGKLNTFLTLTFPDGQSAELEAQSNGPLRFQSEVVALIVALAAGGDIGPPPPLPPGVKKPPPPPQGAPAPPDPPADALADPSMGVAPPPPDAPPTA